MVLDLRTTRRPRPPKQQPEAEGFIYH
jgi:hypothetical protein